MRRWLHPALLTTLVLGCAAPAGESGADAGAVDSAARVDATTIDAADETAPADAAALDATPDSTSPFDATARPPLLAIVSTTASAAFASSR